MAMGVGHGIAIATCHRVFPRRASRNSADNRPDFPRSRIRESDLFQYSRPGRQTTPLSPPSVKSQSQWASLTGNLRGKSWSGFQQPRRIQDSHLAIYALPEAGKPDACFQESNSVAGQQITIPSFRHRALHVQLPRCAVPIPF